MIRRWLDARIARNEQHERLLACGLTRGHIRVIEADLGHGCLDEVEMSAQLGTRPDQIVEHVQAAHTLTGYMPEQQALTLLARLHVWGLPYTFSGSFIRSVAAEARKKS